MVDEKYYKYDNLRGEYEVSYKNTFSDNQGNFLAMNDNLENLEEVLESNLKIFIEIWVFKTFGVNYFFILKTNIKNISFCLTVFRTKPSDNINNILSDKDINIIYKDNKFLIDGRDLMDKDGFIILKSLFGKIKIYDYYKYKPYLGNGYIDKGTFIEYLHKFYISDPSAGNKLQCSNNSDLEIMQRSTTIIEAIAIGNFALFINHIHNCNDDFRYIDIKSSDKDNRVVYYSFINKMFITNLNNDDSCLKYIDKDKTLYVFIYNYDIPECTIVDGFGDRIVIQHAPKNKLTLIK